MDELPGELFRMYFDDWCINLDEVKPKALTEEELAAMVLLADSKPRLTPVINSEVN